MVKALSYAGYSFLHASHHSYIVQERTGPLLTDHQLTKSKLKLYFSKQSFHVFLIRVGPGASRAAMELTWPGCVPQTLSPGFPSQQPSKVPLPLPQSRSPHPRTSDCGFILVFFA